MKIPKIVKLVHIPLTLQDTLEDLKREHAISHTAVIQRGIQLAAAEIGRARASRLSKLYGVSRVERPEAVA